MTTAFLTGSRADFGKLWPLIQATPEAVVLITGQHLLPQYGRTADEVEARCRDRRIPTRTFIDGCAYTDMGHAMGLGMVGLSQLLSDVDPSTVVVHGDRPEAFAFASAAWYRGCRILHIEGGELSGNVDQRVRFAISELADAHFVAHESAKLELIARGHEAHRIFVIGSPESDTICSALPPLSDVCSRYGLDVEAGAYGVLLWHPETGSHVTEARVHEDTQRICEGVIRSGLPFVVIRSNTDTHSSAIEDAYNLRLRGREHIAVLPSMRHEMFLSLVKHAAVMVGNSSAGVREAPALGTWSIDIGRRQAGRAKSESVGRVTLGSVDLALAIATTATYPPPEPDRRFGDGRVAEKFAAILLSGELDRLPVCKGGMKCA